MLVLTRRSQEAVVIGGSVGFERLFKVIVLEVDRGNVKPGTEQALPCTCFPCLSPYNKACKCIFSIR
jgi:Global regulator protein family